MLLESIKEITKDGRIVVDEKQFPSTVVANHMRELKKNIKINRESGFINLAGKAQKELEELLQIYYDVSSKDSQYTKSEYQAKLTSLNNQLSQAKQLGDSEEAKELQKEIDELKMLESGVQDAKVGEQYHIEEYSSNNFSVEDPQGGDSTGPFKTRAEAQRECDKRNISYNKDSDTEAKITDLTEKAKQARAQGYAADQYEVEIEKLKAKDKKTKDTPRDNIERQIDKLEDQLEKATGAEKVRIQAEIDNLEEDLEYNQDSKDILTQDPNK